MRRPGSEDRLDKWMNTGVEERDWGWLISWNNRRAFEGSIDTRDLYAGSGPFMVDRSTGEVSMASSAHSPDHYVELWRRGEWPNKPRPT
jgi:hypothetical protein